MKKKLMVTFLLALIYILTMPAISYAQPYGIGLYNQTTYGNQTSISITTDAVANNIDMPTITPIAGGATVTKNNTVTVTSTDVKGYKLYINAKDNTYMDNLGAHLPASSLTYTYPSVNGTGLQLDTWGFNTNQGANFAGLTLGQVMIDTYASPTLVTGRNTVVTYGIKLDFAMPAGEYTGYVVYTAVPQTN
jgi:hypothetical protein